MYESHEVVRVVVEGERLTYGHLFNPTFAIEISRIVPLSHQRLANVKDVFATETAMVLFG